MAREGWEEEEDDIIYVLVGPALVCGQRRLGRPPLAG